MKENQTFNDDWSRSLDTLASSSPSSPPAADRRVRGSAPVATVSPKAITKKETPVMILRRAAYDPAASFPEFAHVRLGMDRAEARRVIPAIVAKRANLAPSVRYASPSQVARLVEAAVALLPVRPGLRRGDVVDAIASLAEAPEAAVARALLRLVETASAFPPIGEVLTAIRAEVASWIFDPAAELDASLDIAVDALDPLDEAPGGDREFLTNLGLKPIRPWEDLRGGFSSEAVGLLVDPAAGLPPGGTVRRGELWFSHPSWPADRRIAVKGANGDWKPAN